MTYTIVEEVEIHVPPAKVYAAWTDPQQLTAWWGDEHSYLTTEYVADLRPGGHWISRGKSADGHAFSVQGEYLRVEPPHHLSFTWQSDWDDSGPTTVHLDFMAIDSGTLLRLTHSGFTTDASRESHAKGWLMVFGWVKQYVEGGQKTRKSPALQAQA